MFKKILVANDGSEGAFKALVAALRLAHSYKAEAHMICVEEIPWMYAGSREEVVSEKEVADRKFADAVAKAEAEAKHHRVKLVSHIVIGCPAPAIVAFIARDGFDLLVTGFKGHSALTTGSLAKPPTGSSNSPPAPCWSLNDWRKCSGCLQALQSTIYDVRKWHKADQARRRSDVNE